MTMFTYMFTYQKIPPNINSYNKGLKKFRSILAKFPIPTCMDNKPVTRQQEDNTKYTTQ